MSDIFDREPPKFEEGEKAILGSLMMYPEVIKDIHGIISSDDFYQMRNQKIFSAIIALSEEGKQPDVLNVKQKLGIEYERCGGMDYMMDITARTANAKTCIEYAKTIKEHRTRRILLTNLIKTAADVYDESKTIEDLRNNLVRMDENLSSTGRESEQFSKLSLRLIENYQTPVKGEDYISTGYRALDNLRVNFGKKQLIILAARPCMGKSAFAANCISNYFEAQIARQGIILPVLYFNLEMSTEETAMRLHSIMSGVANDKLTFNHKSIDKADWERLRNAQNRTPHYKLQIFDNVYSMNEMMSIIRNVKREFGLAMVFIDYLQLIHPPDRKVNREQQISTMTRSFKQLAKNLHIPIILLSQLNREVKGNARQTRVPQLSDLRESGAIEQDADKVLFIHRMIEYAQDPASELAKLKDKNHAPIHADLEWLKRNAYFICAKNRQYRSGSADLVWHGETLTFTDEDNYNA